MTYLRRRHHASEDDFMACMDDRYRFTKNVEVVRQHSFHTHTCVKNCSTSTMQFSISCFSTNSHLFLIMTYAHSITP